MTTHKGHELSLKDLSAWKSMCERKGISLEMPGDKRTRRMIRHILQDKEPEYFARYKLLSFKEFKALPIEALDLSGRTYNCLYKYNISTVGDILKTTISEFINMRGFGPHCRQDLAISLHFSGVIEYEGRFVRSIGGEPLLKENF